MNIQCLDLTVNDDDLNNVIGRRVPANRKIGNIRAALLNDHLVFNGRITLLLSVDFEASFRVTHTATEIVAQLVKIQPMSAIAAQFKTKILKKIIEFAPFAQLDAHHDSIRIQINDVLQNYDLSTRLYIDDLTLQKNQLSLKLRGSINL